MTRGHPSGTALFILEEWPFLPSESHLFPPSRLPLTPPLSLSSRRAGKREDAASAPAHRAASQTVDQSFGSVPGGAPRRSAPADHPSHRRRPEHDAAKRRKTAAATAALTPRFWDKAETRAVETPARSPERARAIRQLSLRRHHHRDRRRTGNNARNAGLRTTSPGRAPASSKPTKSLVPNDRASPASPSALRRRFSRCSAGVPAEDLGAASAARAPRGAHHRSGPDSSKAAAYSHGDLASAVGPGPRAPGVFSSAAAPAKKRRPPRLQLASDNAAPLEDAGTPLLALNGDGANVGACHVVGDAPGTRDLGGLGPAGGFGGAARARRSGGGARGRKSPRTWSPATTPAETNRRRSAPSSSSRRRGGGGEADGDGLSLVGESSCLEGGRAGRRDESAEDRARRSEAMQLILTYCILEKPDDVKCFRFAVRSWPPGRRTGPASRRLFMRSPRNGTSPGHGTALGKPAHGISPVPIHPFALDQSIAFPSWVPPRVWRLGTLGL